MVKRVGLLLLLALLSLPMGAEVDPLQELRDATQTSRSTLTSQSAATLERCLERVGTSPERLQALNALAVIYRHLDDKPALVRCLERTLVCLEGLPRDPITSQPLYGPGQRRATLYELGLLEERGGHHRAALELYKAAFPEEVEALVPRSKGDDWLQHSITRFKALPQPDEPATPYTPRMGSPFAGAPPATPVSGFQAMARVLLKAEDESEAERYHQSAWNYFLNLGERRAASNAASELAVFYGKTGEAKRKELLLQGIRNQQEHGAPRMMPGQQWPGQSQKSDSPLNR